MLPFRLARVALEAEGLRLRQQARRLASRVIMACFGVILALGALGFLHLAAWFWLRETLTPLASALVVAVCDLLFGAILVYLAFNSSPGAAEREALAVRRRAIEDIAGSVSVSALVLGLIGRIAALRRRN